MNEHGFTRENLLGSLPVSLSGDPKMAALAEAIAVVLAKRREEIRGISIYPHISELDEGLLDILARDFKVDWWDNDYSLEEKRRTLLSSWQVHKLLGTKAAVELAASAVYPITTVQEWFEYGGEPYYFRLNVQLSEGVWDNGKHKRLMLRLQFYKNLRSWLEPVVYLMPAAVLKNAQDFYFTRLSIHAHISNFDEGAILLDGRWNLDGSWQLSRKFTRGAAFHRLLMSMRAVNLASQSLTWTVRAEAHTQSAAALSSLQVCRYSANNLGAEEVLLNGKRPLDGGWLLTALFSKGVKLTHFTWSTYMAAVQSIQAALLFWARAPNANHAAALLVCRSAERNRQTAHASAHISILARNAQAVKASVIIERKHSLNGGFTLDGTKKLNAGTERSEL